MHFLAAGEQNILIQQALRWDAELMVCDQVAQEIERVAASQKYAASGATNRWRNLTARVTCLSDAPELTPGLDRAMSDLDALDPCRGKSLTSRLETPRDLGEFLSACHALALARREHEVIVIIDDRYGRTLVKLTQQILLRDGLNPLLIRIAGTRRIIERSDLAWHRRQDSSAATLANMERYGDIPNWR